MIMSAVHVVHHMGLGKGEFLLHFVQDLHQSTVDETLSTGYWQSNHSLSACSFADDMTLLACFPSCLNIMIQLAYKYSCNWLSSSIMARPE